jgi:cellulose synthase/poly-beta-1,6-N-acetylglucosamine synthase-like glycosyltransferase
MFLVFSILFLVSVGGILHSYLFYPAWLFLTTDFSRKQKGDQYLKDEELPNLAVLCAAYNEEKVIRQKIESVFTTNYPLHKLSFYIGSDASTDATNSIIKELSSTYPQLILVEFPGRTGKSGIINQLAENADAEIFIMTDANVIFKPDTLVNLAKHFKDPEVKQVAANIIKLSPNNDGIASQEKNYIGLENKIKQCESIKWQAVMGAEGGCYAIRKSYFAPVPPKFFMDDFYITMNVLERKGKVLFDPGAICNEDVPTQAEEEFKRKVRISIGNFQNLNRYKGLLMPFWKGVGFAFLSHKVLRWHTPFLLILSLFFSAALAPFSLICSLLTLGQILLILSPLFDRLLSANGIQVGLLRYAGHFYLMNLALLKGFFVYVIGVESNIWEPTKRNT